MASHLRSQDEDDYDDYDEDDEQGEEDDWGLSSTPSPVAHQGRRLTLDGPEVRSGVLKTLKPIFSSPQCSMDDDSSTESEGEVAGGMLGGTAPVAASRAPSRARRTTVPARRGVSKQEAGQMPSSASRIVSTPSSFTSSEQPPADSEQYQATTIFQRKARIKELEMKYHQDCLVHCRALLALQRQWRRELEDPVPGLISFDCFQQDESVKKDNSPSKSEVHMQSSALAVPKSKSNIGANMSLRNNTIADVSSSLKGLSKGPLRRRADWRGNEREALRRGILMFGLGRSEKVRGIMRGLLKQMYHGLGDIADCCWEFVRQCSIYTEHKETVYVEKLLERAKGLGIEMGPEVAERVGQWERMEKLGSVWIKRIRLLDNLGHVVRLCANPETQESAYNAIDSLGDATVPCNWWSRESDLALLAGIYKHGFGSYEALRTDEQFAEAFGFYMEEMGSFSGLAGGRKTKADSHSWDVLGNEKVLPNVRLKGRSSCNDDQRGIQTFAEHDSDFQPLVRDGGANSMWPDSHTLTRRLKRLVEHIGRIGEQVVSIEKGGGRKLRQGRSWSKREKLNFLRLLLTWGLPAMPGQEDQVQWQFFKDQASVRPLKNKKESSFEACYDGLVKEMTHLLKGSDSQEKQRLGSVDHEGSSDESVEKISTDIELPSQAGPAVLTQKSAVRLRDRLELFDTLRQALEFFPEDWRNVGLTIHPSHNLPSWWQIGSHDRQLILGTLKHGFGNWDAVFEDKTNSFKAESEKEKFRKGLTQEGENQNSESSWAMQGSQENDDHVKGKGKRSFSQGGSGSNWPPSSKSCVKRLKFVGNVLRHQLEAHLTADSKASIHK